MSFEEIAKELNISPSRANKIYLDAMRKLRHPNNKDKWLAIFETMEFIEEERLKKENSIKGEKI